MKIFRIGTDPQIFDDATNADIIHRKLTGELCIDVYIELYSRIGLKLLACNFTNDRNTDISKLSNKNNYTS